jgi:hypothetical protein
MDHISIASKSQANIHVQSKIDDFLAVAMPARNIGMPKLLDILRLSSLVQHVTHGH